MEPAGSFFFRCFAKRGRSAGEDENVSHTGGREKMRAVGALQNAGEVQERMRMYHTQEDERK